ncbi:MAG: hydroxylase [Actinobacteria bacterium]|nr:hydroxylase [Actinomycetota bacterium]
MAHEVLERIRELAPYLREQADQAEALRRLPDDTGKQLKATGVVRLLQPKRHGGYEADPRIFFEAVMAIAANCGASGWVSGIIGVHPWELAFFDDRAQAEVWGDDPDTWMSSQYLPGAVARPVDGGYMISGRWSFSSGVDHADWALLGVTVGDADGTPLDPPKGLHILVPASDYTIEDTWHVVGLCGTGSNDIVIEDAFVPTYRTHAGEAMRQYEGPGLSVNTGPLYKMPWGAIFPNAITAPIIGMAEGAFAAHLEHQRNRSSIVTGPVANAPIAMTAAGADAGDIDACRVQLLRNVGDMYEIVSRGETIPMQVRARGRRDQVQGSWRAVAAVDDLFARSGGAALRRGNPLQRLWRDCHAGLNHAINVPDVSFHSYMSVAMGFDPLEMLL